MYYVYNLSNLATVNINGYIQSNIHVKNSYINGYESVKNWINVSIIIKLAHFK